MTDPSLLERAQALDAADPLAQKRSLFKLPDNLIYLDGNSLGPLPAHVHDRISNTINTEWGQHLIRAWNVDGWADLPVTIGEKLARLIGAEPNSVRVTDSTSVNLFKLLSAAIQIKGGKAVILSDTGNFPTDLYVAQGLAASNPDVSLKLVAPEEIEAMLGPEIDILMLTEVDYRTGRKHDMQRLTALAHQHDVLVIWDLAHSAGAFNVNLRACKADFAVGCGYKYLNGGPGAPAFYYVAPKHQTHIEPVLAGWFGHKAPFAFETRFSPADGVDRLRVGTPPILSMVALDAALDVFDTVDFDLLAQKSRSLSTLFIEALSVQAEPLGLTLASPADPDKRGSHVSWRHEQAYPVMQALITRGVIGDMRAPDFLRFGFAPLYNTHEDVVRAAQTLQDILHSRSWDTAAFHARKAVT